jgi:hypothetical protein
METGFAANFAPALSASAARKSEAVAGLILRSAARSIYDLERDFDCINLSSRPPAIGSRAVSPERVFKALDMIEMKNS